MASRINVTRDRIFEEPISPFIYGEFVEFLNDLIPGMWAERIRDRSFEGLTMPKMYYREEKDFPKTAWRKLVVLDGLFGYSNPPNGAEVKFDLDRSRPFAGTQSARIHVSEIGSFLAGIAQDNVAVREGEKLLLELFLRGENLEGDVRVFIGREYGAYPDIYDQVAFDGVGGEWHRFEGELNSSVADSESVFAIVLDGPGTLWIDKVSLMPSNNIGGWRCDVVEAVRSSKPGIIRFGGSSLIYYDWRTGIGPREKRSPFLNRPWNNTEENDVGLDEFLRFCELVEAEPLICTNSNSSTPAEIAQQVEYTNGPVDSEFGRLRAENGHPEPYGVKYWQIGNEQIGEEYEAGLLEYARAMKEVDPSIELLAAFPSQNIIDNLSSDLSFVCPHFYEPDMNLHRTEIDRLRAAIAASPTNPHLKLGVTEWNHTAGNWGDQRAWLQTLENGLFVGRMLNHFQRNGDLIRIANRSNLVNSCFSGSIQTKPLDIYFTPAYYVQKLYSTMSGRSAIKVQAEDDKLDVSGTMDCDSKRIMLWVVNSKSRAIESMIAVGEIGRPEFIRIFTITGPSPSAVNSFERKNNVVPVEQSVEPSETLTREFPPFSVTGMELSFSS